MEDDTYKTETYNLWNVKPTTYEMSKPKTFMYKHIITGSTKRTHISFSILNFIMGQTCLFIPLHVKDTLHTVIF